jgi:hypothetical protein
MDRSIKTVRQLQQVFEPHHVIFMGLKGEKKQIPSQRFCKEKKNVLKILKHCFGGVSITRGFSLFVWGCLGT